MWVAGRHIAKTAPRTIAGRSLLLILHPGAYWLWTAHGATEERLLHYLVVELVALAGLRLVGDTYHEVLGGRLINIRL